LSEALAEYVISLFRRGIALVRKRELYEIW